MAEFRGAEFPQGKPLLCQLCRTKIGLYFGDPPDPETVVARCLQCAAVEEAEAVLAKEADRD